MSKKIAKMEAALERARKNAAYSARLKPLRAAMRRLETLESECDIADAAVFVAARAPVKARIVEIEAEMSGAEVEESAA